MNNVIELNPSNELKFTGYYEMESDVGVAMLDKSLIIMPLNNNEFDVFLGDNDSILFKRKELAEFLHVALTFIDPEDRFKPTVDELVGRDY